MATVRTDNCSQGSQLVVIIYYFVLHFARCEFSAIITFLISNNDNTLWTAITLYSYIKSWNTNTIPSHSSHHTSLSSIMEDFWSIKQEFKFSVSTVRFNFRPLISFILSYAFKFVKAITYWECEGLWLESLFDGSVFCKFSPSRDLRKHLYVPNLDMWYSNYTQQTTANFTTTKINPSMATLIFESLHNS